MRASAGSGREGQCGQAVFAGSRFELTDAGRFPCPCFKTRQALRGFRPEQPVHYSHRLHMEKNQMECLYCHSGVTNSNFATIPSVDTCMGCHKSVKTDSPEIQKLKGFADRGDTPGER